MKKLLPVGLCLLWLMLFGVSSSALDTASETTADAFTVSYEKGEYILCADADGGERLGAFPSLSGLLDRASELASSPKLRFLSVAVEESVELSVDCRILGEVSFSSEVSVASGAEVTLAEAELSFFSSFRIKDATVRVDGARISCLGASAIVMDYSPLASLEMCAGEISSMGAPAIRITTGSLLLTGGRVSSASGVAVSSTVGLTITGAAEISGVGADVYAERQISLSYRGEPFVGRLCIRTGDVYREGEGSPVVWGANAEMEGRITLLDRDGTPQALTYFEEASFSSEKCVLAVAKPYTVRYFVGGELWHAEEYYRGQRLEHPTPPERAGFSFSHFSKEEGGVVALEEAVLCSLDLYASYKLLSPTFSLASLRFVYDGQTHAWEPNAVFHPLLSEGHLSFSWFREGTLLSSSAQKLFVREVGESGSYTLTVTFTYLGESSSATSATVTLTVEKKRIAPPKIPAKTYTGNAQYADPEASADYAVLENGGGTEAGEYPVILTLTDPANTVWESGEESVYTLFFHITRAKNSWVETPTVPDAFFGQTPRPSAYARFGRVKFLFCDREDGAYTEEAPSTVGTYFMIAAVEDHPSYEGLRSVPVSFSILENRVVSLRVEAPPTKTKYTAFECFDRSGMIVRATYLDGSTAIYPTEKIEVKYATNDACLYARDTYLTLCAEGVETVLEVEVVRADYDLGSVIFHSETVSYDGERHTLSFGGNLPVGLDGIALTASVAGGGADAGEYGCTLSFSTQSDNYNLPSPITAYLTVVPISIEISWNIPTFVYDGRYKVPTATYTDVFGTVRELVVQGGAISAGEGYTAEAQLCDNNYEIRNPTASFTICKGSYDMSAVRWVGEGFVYDATQKCVELVGLPSGVTVVAYSDASAVGAGEYLARATLSYDSENYNEPMAPQYAWSIARASYATDSFSFLCDNVVYNGEIQYPALIGTLPVGLDGSRLAFSFDRGVKDVLEGTVLLHAVFFTDSQNYLTPDPIPLSLRVLPLGVSVTWTELSFVYDGTLHLPCVSHADLPLSLSGGGVDAGEYVAFCSSLDPNYLVINDRMTFTVHRAPNRWISPLVVCDVYESGTVSPLATPKVGEVVYRYYSDPEGISEIARPSKHGSYYVAAYVAESKNYLSLSSALLPFEILEVLPKSLTAWLNCNQLFAFDKISSENLTSVLAYNDGSEKHVDGRVLYRDGDSLRVGDTAVTVVYGEFSALVEVMVLPARMDLSGVSLSDTSFVFDGAPHTPKIIGLPSGVTVAGIEGGDAVLTGQYELVVTLAYDTANYEAVEPLRFAYSIEKRRIQLPLLPSLLYTGTAQSVSVPHSEDYTVMSVGEGRDAGRYTVVLALRDPFNTAFADTEEALVSLEYEILPLPITVRMSDLTVYRDGASAEVTYSIVEGVVLSGDTLSFTPVLSGSVGAVFHAPNYSVTVIEGELRQTSSLSPEARERTATWIVLLLILLLLVALALFYKPLASRLRYQKALAHSNTPIPPTEPARICAPKESIEQEISDALEFKSVVPMCSEEESDDEASFQEDADVSVSIDEGRADRLMRDESAREMIGKEKEAVVTYGRRHSIINVDTLSQSFAAGERVDVNLLKERSLIPYDTGYLKVLARGCIDKPLHVYANDFSLSAVKMLLLSGGSATRVRTVGTTKHKNKKK